MAATFTVSVVTPEREVFSGEARFVALPAYDGEMGVLARRAPLVVQLGSGRLRIDLADGSKRELFVAGGFAQMVEDRLSVLTEEAVEPSALAETASRESLAAAQRLPAGTDEDWSRKQRALARARALGRIRR